MSLWLQAKCIFWEGSMNIKGQEWLPIIMFWNWQRPLFSTPVSRLIPLKAQFHYQNLIWVSVLNSFHVSPEKNNWLYNHTANSNILIQLIYTLVKHNFSHPKSKYYSMVSLSLSPSFPLFVLGINRGTMHLNSHICAHTQNMHYKSQKKKIDRLKPSNDNLCSYISSQNRLAVSNKANRKWWKTLNAQRNLYVANTTDLRKERSISKSWIKGWIHHTINNLKMTTKKLIGWCMKIRKISDVERIKDLYI